MSGDVTFHEEEALGKAYDARLMRRLLRYLRPYWKQVAVALFVLLLAAAVNIVGPWVTQLAIDEAIPNQDGDFLRLLAFAFLIGVVTSSTGVSLMSTYAVFFLAAILSAHKKIAAAMSSEWAAKLIDGLYWVFPKTAELGRATVASVGGNQVIRGAAPTNLFAVYGTTALFGLAALALACWLFSRKDF